MEKAVYGPPGCSWLKVALVVARSWLMLLWLAAWNWANWYPKTIVLAGFLMVALHACALAQLSLLQRRYQEEWGRLPSEIPS
jgi:hypothetical protein